MLSENQTKCNNNPPLAEHLNASKKRYEFKLSTFFFVAFFCLIPFDDYLGFVLPFSLLSLVYLGFIVFTFFEILDCKIGFKINTVVLYLIYSVFSILFTVFKSGLSYNNLLFFEMLVFYIVFSRKQFSVKECRHIINTTPFIIGFYILLNLCYLQNTDIGIYVLLKDIVDPNYFVTNMCLVLVLYCFNIQLERKKPLKILKMFILLAYFVIIALIGSRGGLLASVIAVVVYFLTQSKKPLKAFLCMLVVLLIAVMLANFFLPEYISQRFTFSDMIEGGGSGRLTIWENYFAMYSELNLFGLLFGVGRNSAPSLYLENFGRPYYAHNIFVRALLETGIFGLALLIVLMIFILRKGIKEKNGALVAALLGFVTGAFFLDMDNMRVFWLLIAFATIKIEDNKTLYVWRGKVKC